MQEAEREVDVLGCGLNLGVCIKECSDSEEKVMI